MKKVFSPNSQTDEMLKVLFDNYPNFTSTHQIRKDTYIVDVPKTRNRIQDRGVDIESKVIGTRKNKFGRIIDITGYKIEPQSIVVAQQIIDSCMIEVPAKPILGNLFRKFTMLVVLIIAFSSCVKTDDDGFIVVNHSAGKHHADFRDKKSMVFSAKNRNITVEFNESCKYIHEHQLSWNKIFGRGWQVFINDNGNRYRAFEDILTWRYNPRLDGWEIAQYSRNEGVMSWTIIDTLNMSNPIGTYSLEFIPMLYDGVITAYFGGRIPAPHDMYYRAKFH